MAKPAKTAFMDLVQTALSSVVSAGQSVLRRPTIATDKDVFKSPFIRFAYFGSRKRRDDRVQFVDFDLQVEASIERSSTQTVDEIGETLQADIDMALTALAGTQKGVNPCMKIECTMDDIFYFDNEFKTGMAASVYSVTLVHEWKNPYGY